MREKRESGRQKADGTKQNAELKQRMLAALYVLPTAFCLLFLQSGNAIALNVLSHRTGHTVVQANVTQVGDRHIR